MALQGWGKICRAQPDLKFISPLVEDLLGILGEPHGGYTFLIFATRAEVLRVQGIEPPEDVVGPVLRLDIWPTVHVSPSWVRVGAKPAAGSAAADRHRPSLPGWPGRRNLTGVLVGCSQGSKGIRPGCAASLGLYGQRRSC